MAHRLEPGSELRLGLADPLGHRSDLAVVLGHDHDDPVGLAQLVGAQHDPDIAIQLTHRRRVRRTCDADDEKSSIAAARSVGTQFAPADRDEHQLGVGELPHQRRRQLRRRTEHDDQVRFAIGRFVERRRDGGLVDLVAAVEPLHRVGESLPPVAARVDDDVTAIDRVPPLGELAAGLVAALLVRPQRQPRHAEVRHTAHRARRPAATIRYRTSPPTPPAFRPPPARGATTSSRP